MKVLHVVSSLNVGGAERFVIDLATEQKEKHGFCTSVLSMGKQGEPLENEVKRFGIGLLHGTGICQLKSYLSSFDIVHVHSSYSLLRILLASLFLPIKVIYTRHNERVHTSMKWRLIYFLARFRLHKMIFVAEKARQNYLAIYPAFASKSCTVLNGVLPMIKPTSESKKFRIAHVGRFVPLKAQHHIIQAIALLPEEIKNNVMLFFYGTGELLEKNKTLAKDLIPNVDVNFMGFVTDRNIIYENTDCLVIASETEGLSLSIIEALASGTPTIASNVGGNPELIKNDINGLLFEYADVNKLAELLTLLMQDKSLYQKFSQQSIALFEAQFAIERCTKKYLEEYAH
jgi:glycosyltransferase involved in cell wall biosynthesis